MNENILINTKHNNVKDTLKALEEVIRSKQEKDQKHDPTPSEYFALITSLLSITNDGENLSNILRVLMAVIPNTSVIIIRSAFKSLTISILRIIKYNQENNIIIILLLNILNEILLKQEHSERFWLLIEPLHCINTLFSYIDNDNTNIRTICYNNITNILIYHNNNNIKVIRDYYADFILEIFKITTRSNYKRSLYLILLLEKTLIYITDTKILNIIELLLKLQNIEIPKLTAAIFRSIDSLFQSSNYKFSLNITIKIIKLLLNNKIINNNNDMESIYYYCNSLCSSWLILYKLDNIKALSLLSSLTNMLISKNNSEFIQIHTVIGSILKRIIIIIFNKKLSLLTKEENIYIKQFLNNLLLLLQLKYQLSWLYILDTIKILLQLFKQNNNNNDSNIQYIVGIIKKLSEIYQNIELRIIEVAPNIHISLEECLGTALKTCGVQNFLSIMPLQIDTVDNNTSNNSGIDLISTSREWIIRLLLNNIKNINCELAEYGRMILPIANDYYKLVKSYKNKTLSSTEQQQITLWRTRITQLWSLLPEFCQQPVLDIERSFPRMASILEKMFSDDDYPELVPIAIATLHNIIRSTLTKYPQFTSNNNKEICTQMTENIGELRVLRDSCYKIIPLLLQYLEGMSISDNKFQEGIQCISQWIIISPMSLIEAISTKLLQLVLSSTTGLNDSMDTTEASGWMAVMLAIIPQVPPSLVIILYKAVRPLLILTEVSNIQKRAYNLLISLLKYHNKIIVQYESAINIITIISEALLSCHISTKTLRLKVIELLIIQLNNNELYNILIIIFDELLISIKDNNKKTRDIAVTILKYFISNLQPNQLWLLFENNVILQDDNNSMDVTTTTTNTNNNKDNNKKSAALTGLILLLLNYRNDTTILTLSRQLLPKVCLLLENNESSTHPQPHLTKAILSYLRVMASIQPIEHLQLSKNNTTNDNNTTILPLIIHAFTESLGMHKAKFSSRCRAIMRKLLNRIGEDTLRDIVPDSDVALLDYICKHNRRSQRRKEGKEQHNNNNVEDRYLGSDSEDDEENDNNVKVSNDVTPQPVQQADYRLGARPKATRANEFQQQLSATLPSSLDDLLEDQTSALSIQRGNTIIPTKLGVDDDGFNVVVTQDGKVVVKSTEQPEKRVGKKRSLDDGNEEEQKLDDKVNDQIDAVNRFAYLQKNDGQNKRRKLVLKEPGAEYRPKKGTGGDVWKKGMLEPHAYIPLDPRLLSKKHRAEAVSHFGVVVKGGKKSLKKSQKLVSGRGNKPGKRRR